MNVTGPTTVVFSGETSVGALIGQLDAVVKLMHEVAMGWHPGVAATTRHWYVVPCCSPAYGSEVAVVLPKNFVHAFGPATSR